MYSKKTIAAICGATVFMANNGYLDTIEHTSNGLPYLQKLAPNYKGEKFYQQQPCITSGHIITANGAAMIEFTIAIFKKMQAEMKSDYAFKFDLIRNYLMEIIHGALKLQPSETLYQHPDANARIAALFTELLERQFPIENPAQQFNMRSARDYAEQLHVHTNHLNRAIRTVTGKTTSQHIAERLTVEAKALLRHTNWNIAEISYSLGFEEPSHFSNFFKKNVNLTPLAWRTATLA